jgi:hypothetical protein
MKTNMVLILSFYDGKKVVKICYTAFKENKKVE